MDGLVKVAALVALVALLGLTGVGAQDATRTFKFDFGSGAAAAGWIKVTPETAYQDERGFGFEAGQAPIAVTHGGEPLKGEATGGQIVRVSMSRHVAGCLRRSMGPGSQLPHADSSNWSCGTAGSPATLPCEAPFFGVNNGGDAPLKVTKVELWEEFSPTFGDGGGPTGGIFQICNPANPGGPCRAFSWKNSDGGNPNQYAPHNLAATTNPMNPTQISIGRLVFGEACLDGGLSACSNQPFKLYAVVSTDDPYNPTVVTNISGFGQ